MKKTGEYIRKIINSNFPAYIFLFILTAALIIDTAMIAVSIAAYAISGNAANLENITTYALIISFAPAQFHGISHTPSSGQVSIK